eukprot:15456192-Alexandrium_andersonii.AAC.2
MFERLQQWYKTDEGPASHNLQKGASPHASRTWAAQQHALDRCLQNPFRAAASTRSPRMPRTSARVRGPMRKHVQQSENHMETRWVVSGARQWRFRYLSVRAMARSWGVKAWHPD